MYRNYEGVIMIFYDDLCGNMKWVSKLALKDVILFGSYVSHLYTHPN